jgi:CelD/BcsL family acetyltransferase involved in cellulose biosynthesis
MDSLRDRWEALYDTGEHTMFQSLAWNRLAAHWFADREQPFVSYFENDNGAALVPAVIAGKRIGIIGERLFDYRDVLTAGDLVAVAEAWRPIAELDLSLSVTAVRGVSLARWATLSPSEFCDAPAVRRCEASADSIEACHRKLGRFNRRLRRQGVTLHGYNGTSSELLRWIYRRKAEQFNGSPDNMFADVRRAEFVVAAAAMRPSSCDIFTYELENHIVAALVTFRDTDVRRFYTVWFDSTWAKESPGQVLVYEATLAALGDGLDCDYMTGEQPHKARLATSAQSLYRIELAAEEFRRSIDRTFVSTKAA